MEKQQAIAALAALAHDTRLDVFRLLVRAGSDGSTPGALAGHLSLPAATLSFHLKELKSAGVIGCERRGRSLIYRARFDSMSALLAYLSVDCCAGLARVADCA